MIDGRGKVRITDFGLAGVAGSFGAEERCAGTPAYMAPEQFSGTDASIQSDVYALGLVLYEVFTGKRAFGSTGVTELRRAHEHSSPTNPSLLVKDIDPIAERVILRCLEKDPAKRPATALQVAAALPGGDPLAAALAAGETPSPEMVAASGESEGLRPVVAWLLLAGVIVSVTAAILLSAQTMLYRRVPLEKPPDALAERARDILQSVGLFRAAGGHGDGVLRGERVSTLYRGTRQVEDALEPPRDRGVRVLVSRQPAAVGGSILLLAMDPCREPYGQTTRRSMCPG